MNRSVSFKLRLISLFMAAIMAASTFSVASSNTLRADEEDNDEDIVISDGDDLESGETDVDLDESEEDSIDPVVPNDKYDYFNYIYGRYPIFDSEDDIETYIRECSVKRDDVFCCYVRGIPASRISSAVYERWHQVIYIHTGLGNEGDYLECTYNFDINSNVVSMIECGKDISFVTMETSFKTTLEQEEELEAEVSSVLESLDLENDTDYQKLLKIYTWMAANLVYDYDNYYLPAYQRDQLIYTAYYAGVRKKAVCQGFAALLYKMLLDCGVENRVIRSMPDNHAWNIVKINGLYYNVDITWDLGHTPNRFDWFLTSCDDFVTSNHSLYNDLYRNMDYAIAAESLLGKGEPEPVDHEHEFDNKCDADCNICGIERRTLDHYFDGRCDPVCNECGYEKENPSEHHFYYACGQRCYECGYVRTDIAEHIYDNNCDAQCNVCGVTREVEGHVYDNACDSYCNECGYYRMTEHAFDNSCDEECNICGYTRNVYHAYSGIYDDTCDLCGATREVAAQPSATESTSEPTPVPTAIPTVVPTVTVAPVPTQVPESEVEDGAKSFVERLYTVALGRTADENGLNSWVEALHNGTTGAEAAKGFLFSDEFINKEMTNTEFVEILYHTFFNRDADQGGLTSWVRALRTEEMTKQEVIQGFIDSSEWSNVCLSYGITSGGSGVPTIEVQPNDMVVAFATRLYTTCLKRTPDQGGLMAWATQLANLRDTGTNAAHGFFFSEEMNSANISNEDFVTRLYQTFMDRNPDEAGFNAWVGQLNSGEATREEVFQGFAQSNEFGVICNRYGIIC